MPGEELIVQHRAMVVGLAGRLRRELSLPGELDDLIAFGFGGLLEAQRRYDPSRGVRFSTFAYHRVRGAMLDGVRSMAAMPRRAHERSRVEGEPMLTAIPSSTDKAFARISASLTSAAPIPHASAEESPESTLLQGESIQRMLEALGALPDRQRALLRGHYFEGRQLDELAAELGISRSWASRLHVQALRVLREALQSA